MNEEQMQPAMAGHDHKHGKGWMITAIVFIILFILSSLAAGWFMMQASADQQQLDELDAEMGMMQDEMDEVEEMMEDEKDEIMGGEEVGKDPLGLNSGLRSILFDTHANALPFGAAELKGRFVYIDQRTDLDPDGTTVKCTGFVIEEGDPGLIEKMLDFTITDPIDGNPVAVIGEENESLVEQGDGELFVLVDTRAQGGEHVSCEPWPFESTLIK